jgi:hypothetical protein
MWPTGLVISVIFLCVVGMIAVLQGWSSNNDSQREIGVAFLGLMGMAAVWGLRTLFGGISDEETSRSYRSQGNHDRGAGVGRLALADREVKSAPGGRRM